VLIERYLVAFGLAEPHRSTRGSRRALPWRRARNGSTLSSA